MNEPTYERARELLIEAYYEDVAMDMPLPEREEGPVLTSADVTYSNWEYHPDRPMNRNYRSMDNPDFYAVLEHSTRRGPNLEAKVTLVFDIGSESDYTSKKQEVRERQQKLDRLAALEAEATNLRKELDIHGTPVVE